MKNAVRRGPRNRKNAVDDTMATKFGRNLIVDSMITDQIALARECIYLSRTSDIVSEYVKWLSE